MAEGERKNQHVPPRRARVGVIGAGIMGTCSAYYLQRKGYQVSLFDKRGPGNSASSSGGESRLLRLIYGSSDFYSELTYEAIPLWLELQKNSEPFFIPSPVLWISGEQNKSMIENSLTWLDSKKVGYKVLSKDYLNKNWPFMTNEDIDLAVMEEMSGYLKARYACQAIASQFNDAGGEIILEEVKAVNRGTELNQLETAHNTYKFDYVVIAAGPWLNQWVEAPLVEVSRQEVLFFDVRDLPLMRNLTSWVDLSYEPYFYGIPGDLSRGFKLACDTRGPAMDPDTDNRTPTPGSIEEARKFLAYRFPALGHSALVESRVCQYSNSADRNLILDVHPQFKNALILGGGSGHGFKYGPAIGKTVAEFVAGERTLPREMMMF